MGRAAAPAGETAMISEMLLFAGGVLFGAAVVLLVHMLRRRDTREIARALVTETEAEKVQDLETVIARMRDSFGALSQDALRTSTGELLKLAREQLTSQLQLGERDLDGKKKLIDQTLENLRADLRKMTDQVSGFEKDRVQKFGELSAHLVRSAEQTSRLQETANHLHQALASTKTRGQWGERMADDVLRLAGFVEGINYLRQKVLDAASSRPDYTFNLPQGLKVNMDVKFPLSSYLRYLECENDVEREAHKARFLKDVRLRVKEVTTRDYINPEDKTLDYVLVFIPNEQVYAFINQNDPGLIDEALRTKVILCSPFTLFAILAIIRQSLDNFSMEKTAADMLRLVNAFKKEWEKFADSMEKMGEKLEAARREYQALTTTRHNKLDKSIQKIEDMRRQKGIDEEIALVEGEVPALEAGDAKEPAD
ncbi:MAG: recombination protein RmuC [Candidatus Aminicenantes bacterium]|jgi:DNA recombination protein RmuC|nr:recombination protein RmuC [Candidatus Aminicenantes bacterium]